MFKKKPNVKPLSPLRSSDRRKIADQIIADYGIEVPKTEVAEAGSDEQTPAAVGLGALRNSLLPDHSLSARFTTTAGPNLKQVSGTIYAGAHPGQEQRILWIKIEERLYPTVYTLWHNPRITPLLHTPEVVLRKLRGGADLMTPGLARGPPFPSKATKDTIVAIASLENPSVPMVVGVCEIDVSALQQVQGAKGHAVRGVHWDGDEIWAWSTSGKPGGNAPQHIDGWDIDKEPDVLSRQMEDLRVEDSEDALEDDQDGGGVALNKPSERAQSDFVNGEDAPPYEKVDVDDKQLSTREIDDIFRKAFLYGLHHHRNTHKEDPHHGLEFPIPQSLIVSNLILPYLPISRPAQAASLQIRKTSWKNAKKFIKTMDKEKLLKSKDRNGGETVVVDIDFEDLAIINFVPYKLPKKDTPTADTGGGGGGKAIAAGGPSGDDSIGQQLKKIILFRPKEKLSPVFEASNSNVKHLYLPAELRPIINSYIENENLVSTTNKRLVNLNPILANAVFDGRSSLDSEVLAKGSVPRDALIERILESCSPFYAILRNEETRDDVKAKAGQAPKLQILLETRSGNKTVTKVSGVEAFYINPQALAEELQKACASSTSVGQLVGSSPKNPVMEIMVQGPQKEVVCTALEKRGVNRHWIEVADKTKGKKR
ncbi:MAG: eukaryotic translation initiation factor SUI1 family [Lasallia pustulata]|uniref:Eukaryotic translation initiation factor SUI1 family n=1 Tax=Lasallia pustulata TaxID=136370 RepID=A0A5M8PJG9_9LECA|nr:MAG: eukaryotic translation initiation factor SUI1 family [Lasallia pustulata]